MASESSTPTPAKKGKLRSLLARFGSTVALWALIGSTLFFAKPILFYLMIGGVMLVAIIEYFDILHFRKHKWEAIVTILISMAYFTGSFWQAALGNGTNFQVWDGVAIAAVIFAGFILHMRHKIEPGVSHIGVMICVFGFIYVAYLFNYLTRIVYLDDGAEHMSEAPGRTYLLFLLAVTKFADVGAYLLGSAIGKHKMIPHISPGKTWEGMIGAFGAALLCAFLIKWLLGADAPLLTTKHTAILALLMTVGGILGDLAESTLKRSLGTKDSGLVLPGIGGALDLIDSVLFTAPIVYFYLLWLNQ